MIAGFGHGAVPRKISPPPPYSGFPIGVIRWDAWSNDPTLNWYTSAGFNEYYGATAKFNCRRASQWQDSQLWGPGVNTQKCIDAELAFCKNKIDYWMYDLYPPAFIVNPGGDPTQQSNISNGLLAHVASPLKNNVKFCVLLQGFWWAYPNLTDKYATDFANYLVTLFADPAYQRVGGLPLVSFYNDTTSGNLNWTLARYNAMTAITGPVFGIAVSSVTLANNLGLKGIMRYGPNGAFPSGSGERPASLQASTDAGTWGAVPGQLKIVNWTFFQDRRPFAPTTTYSDKYSQPELVAHIANGLAVAGAQTGVIYSHSEETEGGPGLAVTFQEASRHYDALYWARGGPKPARFQYELSCHSAAVSSANAILLGGTWNYQFPDPNGVQGAHDNDEMWTSSAGATMTIAHDRLQEFTVVGSTDAGLGSANIRVDGSIVGVANYAGPTKVRQPIFNFKFTDNPPVSHTVAIEYVASSGTIRQDSLLLTYKP